MVSLLSASSAIDDDDFMGVIPSNDHAFLDDLIHPSEELLGNKSTHQLVVAAEEGVAAAASPWWITFIQEEGLLDLIEPQQKRLQNNADETFFLGGIDNEDDGDLKEDPAVTPAKEDDVSVADEEGDWKERLWVIARNHWSVQLDGDFRDAKPEEAELQLLSASNIDENEQVKQFRNLLLQCLDAYVQVFGDIPGNRTPTQDTTHRNTKDGLATEAASLSPYVPLKVVRRLFQQVLLNHQPRNSSRTRTDSDESNICNDNNDEPKHRIPAGPNDPQFLAYAEYVTQLLLSPSLDMFRTYMVEALHSNDDLPTKRVRIDQMNKERQTPRDIEHLLYGDMYAEEKKEEGEKSEEEQEDEMESEEEEVRLKTGMLPLIHELLKEQDLPPNEWRLPFLKEVLLHGLLKDSLSSDHISKTSLLVSRVDRRSETSLAYMYSIRYFPHFYLRAAWNPTSDDFLGETAFGFLMQYFSDPRLIRNRLVVLGVYNGVMVHLQELNSLFEELHQRTERISECEEMYRDVHRAIHQCLVSILEENMKGADFLLDGQEWKASDTIENPQFSIESDHPQVVSVCLEIGRSFHFQGVTLGRREQERLEKTPEKDDSLMSTLQKVNFDDDMTDLEVAAYLYAQSSHRGALIVLRRAETAIRSSVRPMVQLQIKNVENYQPQQELLGPDKESARQLDFAMKHISEAQVTIELYLSDTLTTLAYCYDVKLSDYKHALASYNESLALYARHVGKDHPTVAHTLHSVGCIHLELEQWKEAMGCFEECLAHFHRSTGFDEIQINESGLSTIRPRSDLITPKLNEEIAAAFKCLGIARKKLGDYDGAIDSFSKSMDRRILSLKGSGEFPKTEDPSNPNAVNGPPRDQFVADIMSKLVDTLFSKLSRSKSTYSRRRLAMLYTDDDQFDLQSIDGPRLTRLQIERRAIEITRDVVKLREGMLKLPDRMVLTSKVFSHHSQGDKCDELPPWHKLLEYVCDLTKLGKLYFRRCDYSDARQCWDEAYSFLIQKDDPDSLVYDDLQFQSRSLQEAAMQQSQVRVTMLSELCFLMGVASSRLGEHDKAVNYIERALNFLEQKRKLLNDRIQTKSSDDEWDILDLDIGFCEHALGLANVYNNKFTPATSHYREALRLFEAVAARRKGRQKGDQLHGDQGDDDSLDDDSETRELKQEPQHVDEKKNDLDIAINGAIASVMLSLGGLYHDQQKSDRARRFLEGAIQIVHSATNKILSMERDSYVDIPSITGFSSVSLVVSILRVGDAHRRIALMDLEKQNEDDAKVAFEAAMRYLESTNLEARLTLNIDDEQHLENINQENINQMLLCCYDHLMTMLDKSKETNQHSKSRSSRWFGFGNEREEDPDLLVGTGLTREDLLFRLGNVYAKSNQYDAAIRCFMESKLLTEERLGTSDHNIIGNILFNLGNIYKNIYAAQRDKTEQKAKERAIEAFDESLRIARLTSGPDAMSVAEVMESLAALLMDDDDPQNFPDSAHDDEEEATKLLREAVSIRVKHRSEMSLAFGQSMHCLGLLCLRQQMRDEIKVLGRKVIASRLDEAITCFAQALRVRKVLLGDHLEVASTSHNLGVALCKKAVVSSGVRAVPICDALKHLNDSLFVRTLFLERSGRDGADKTGKEQTAWRWELDGISDIKCVVIDSVENLYDIALLHESQGNYEIEQSRLHDALTLIDTWTESSTHDEWGRERKAAVQITITEKNSWRAKVYHNLGVSWFEVGNYEKAASEFEESLRYRGLDIFEISTPDEVFDTFFRQKATSTSKRRISSPLPNAITMEKLALSYDKLGQYDDALRCYAFALRVYGEHHGDESLKIADVLKRIGKVYQDRHDYKRCVRALQRALHIRDMFDEGDASPLVDDALVFVQLARALMALGAYDQVALDHFYSAVGILEDVNHHNRKCGPQQPAMVPRAISGGLISKDENRGIMELLLESHSSILVLIRRNGTDIPDDEDRVCEVLHRIGNAQASLGQFEKALKSLLHVLQFQRSAKGNDHLSVADLLFNLGNIYVEIGQLDRARECHQECHVVTSEVLGKDNIELAENMICCGNVEFLSNNFPLALERFDDALRLLGDKKEFEVAMSKVLQRKAVAHDKLGDYDQAIDCFGDVLKLGRRLWGPNDVELSNALNSLGNVHRNRGELRRSLRCYEESLRIRQLAGDRLSVANTKNNIGAIFTSMDQISHARQFYADALRIKTDELGVKHIETARTLYNMGQLYVADKQYKKSLDFFEESLRIFSLQLGDDHNDVASCLCSIGTVYDEMNDEDLALSYFKRALSAVKGQGGSLSVKASALHNVGIILTKRNDIDHAVRIFREALEMKGNHTDAKDISDTQYCLANVLRMTGCMNEALELHRSALKTRIRFVGADHTDVANSLFGLAQTLVDNDCHKDALEILRECRRIRVDALGAKDDEVADATFLLGIVLREAGKLGEALGCLKEAFDVKSFTKGKESLEVADIAFKIAIVMCELGNYDEAKSYNLRALQIRMEKMGDVHPEVASTMENMGIIEQKLGEHQNALSRLEPALEIKRRSLGDQHDDISNIAHALARSYSELGQFERALRLFDDALRRKKVTHGSKHIEVARTLIDQGKTFERINEIERALMCYEEAVDTDCFEDNSWEIGRVFMRMGISHFLLSKSEDAWDCLTEATRVFELVERKQRRMGKVSQSDRDLRDLVRCYECMLRISEGNPTRYNIDRSLVLPKVASVLVEIKQYNKAATLYRDSITIQKSLPGDTRFVVATNLHNLGNCLHQLGDFNEAMICFEDSLGLLQEIPGLEGKHLADTYQSLAFVHQSRSDLQESLSCYSNALKSRRGHMDSKDQVVTTLANMGEVLRLLGMYDSSIKSCKDALRLIDTKEDANSVIVSQIVECIGLTHKERFEYEKSLSCYHECLKQRRAVGEKKNEVSIAKTLHEMGIILLLKGEKEKSQECFDESLEIMERQVCLPQLVNAEAVTRLNALKDALKEYIEGHVDKHPIEAAEILSSLGSLLELAERTEEAILCNEIAIKFMEEALGPDHLIIATVKHRMGAIRFKLGEYDRSVGRLREALHVRRTKLGDKHILTEDTLKMLARAYAAAGDTEMALFYFKEIMSTKKDRTINKSDKDGEADLLLRLGKLHLEQHEYSEALTCLKDSLKLQRQTRTLMDEQKLGDTLQCMGSSLLELRQFQEARVTLLSALKILERRRDDGSEMLNTTYLLGRVNEDEKSFDKALAWFDKSLGIWATMEVHDQKMKARITLRVGMVKFGLKEYEEALTSVKDAQNILAQELGTSHYEYCGCLHTLGRILFAMKKISEAKECFQAALQIRQQHSKPNDAELGESLFRLGACLYELQLDHEAQSCLGEALRIGSLHAGEDDEEIGEIQRYLGHVEYKLGKLGPAMEHFQNAIRIGLRSLHDEGNERDYEELLSCFDACIEMAKSSQNQDRLAKLYHQQGSVQSHIKMYKKAMSSFTEAIQCYKTIHGEDHLSVANALFNVGICLKETGDSDRAMKCFARALAITKSQLGEDHSDVADTLQQMAEVYRMKGDMRGALKWCEQAMQIRRETEDLQLATLLSFTGELCIQCHDSEEAERSFRECVRIRRKLQGDDHLEVAEALFSLGRVYETFRKDHKRALRCFEECLRSRKATQNDDDLETARTYLHLGSVHSCLHNDAKAAFCFNQATAICFQQEQPDNEVVEDAIVGQGQAMVAQGKFEEALILYEKARIMRRNRSSDERHESSEMADLRLYESEALEKLGRNQEALARLNSALDVYKSTVGIEHLSTANALQRLAELYLDMDQKDEALSFAQQALKIRKALLGKSEDAIGDSYFVVGKVFFMRNEFDTALPCLDAAFDIFRLRRGVNDLSVADTIYYIGCIHEARKHWEEAVEQFQRALAARQKSLGRDHLLVGEVLFKLGTLHGRREEWDLGSDCFSECLRIRTLVRGADHLEVADTLFQLAGCLKYSENKGKLDPSQCYADAIRVYRQVLGENDVSVGKCLAKLGGILDAKNDHKKAGGCYERAVVIFESQLREDPSREEMNHLSLEDDYDAYAGALFDYGTFLDRTGSDGSAMKTYRRALQLYQTVRGRDHEMVGTTLCKIASVLSRLERFTEAMQLYGEVLKRRISEVGDTHPLVADVYYGMSQLLDKKKEYQAATLSIEKCLRIRRATLGPWSEEVADTLIMAGVIQRNRASFKGAMESWDEALAVYKKAGVADEDEKVIDVLKLVGAARQMQDSLEGV